MIYKTCINYDRPGFYLSFHKRSLFLIKLHLILVVCMFVIIIPDALGSNQIMITISSTMNKIIFDGKWSFLTEWKESSLSTLDYEDGTEIQIRTAHQDNFIFVFIDELSNTNFEKGSDSAMVCLDTNKIKPSIANSNDYCFSSILDNKNSFVLQGDSPLGINGNFKKISSSQFIGVGGISDQNDRYTNIPHRSYEFKIPTDLVGRSDVYGFYVGVYDSHSNKMYSWPQDVVVDSPLKIPSPNQWGEVISPDKTLPEFPWPTFALVSSLIVSIYLTRYFLIKNTI